MNCPECQTPLHPIINMETGEPRERGQYCDKCKYFDDYWNHGEFLERKRMKVFIDCEYNGMGGQLLSMALVSDVGDELYFVVPVVDPIDSWVKDNVIPILEDNAIPVGTAKNALQQYLMRYDSVHLIADWPDDIKYFCEFLITGPGERIDTPPLTMEINRALSSEGSEVLHNALYDARAIKEDYRAREEKQTR